MTPAMWLLPLFNSQTPSLMLSTIVPFEPPSALPNVIIMNNVSNQLTLLPFGLPFVQPKADVICSYLLCRHLTDPPKILIGRQRFSVPNSTPPLTLM